MFRRATILVCVLFLAQRASATLITTQTDTDSATNVIDGVIGASEYGPGDSYSYTGAGAGFGGQLGPARLLMNSDAAYLYIAFTNLGVHTDTNQYLVYVNTRPGGFQTAGGEMTDGTDQGRRNTSYLSTQGAERVTFEDGGVSNKPDFCLCFNNRSTNGGGFSAMFELRGSPLTHLTTPRIHAGLGTSNVEFRIPRSSLGLGISSVVEVAAFEVSGNGYMSNEGIPPPGLTTNIGFALGQTNIFRDFHRFLLAPSTEVGLTQRVANTTLNVPQTAPVAESATYSLTNAFPGLSFVAPVDLATPPGETNRLFVVEQWGRIMVISNLANPTASVFLDIRTRVNAFGDAGESGLLGLTFHPGYVTNGYFFVYYNATNNGQSNRVARFQVSSTNPNIASATSEVLYISQFDECANHNGGGVAFDTNGYLLVSLGDEGGGNDDCNGGNSQRIDKDFFSGLLRIDVDKRPGNVQPNRHPSIVAPTNYLIPADNPWIGATQFEGNAVVSTNVRTEYYAVGLRNPFRFSFDDVTHELYVGDVGQGTREEVDIVQKGGNYGWKYYEGFITNPAFVGSVPAGLTNPIKPILDYQHIGGTNGGNVITGGRVYRGSRFPELVGKYVFCDEGSGNIWSLTNNGTNATTMAYMANESGIAAFGRDPRNGDLLMADVVDGVVWRLEHTVSNTNFPQTLSAAGVFADLGSLTPYPGIVPFDINVPFWSDNAIKRRWITLPDTNLTITFNRDSPYVFPTTTVWVKHFDLQLTSGVPSSAIRLETRLLVKNADGSGGYGVTYRWGGSTNDASLVFDSGLDESFVINDGGTIRTQVWHYPSRAECLTCHRTGAGFALGFNTPQLHKEYSLGPPFTNQIMAFSDAGYFSAPVTNYHTLRAIVPATNNAYSLEYRVRSYFQANCAQCHFPGSPVPASWIARVTTPISLANIINGALSFTGGNPVITFASPGQVTNSMVWFRINTRGLGQMPPLASNLIDTQDVALVVAWINALSGYQTFAQWQLAQFGSTNGPNTGVDEDFDGDGSDNHTEYLTGKSPTNGTQSWAVGGVNVTGVLPQIAYERIANRGFDVEYTTNLTDGVWSSLDVPGNAPFMDAVTENATVDDTTTNNPTDQRYYRVRLYEP